MNWNVRIVDSILSGYHTDGWEGWVEKFPPSVTIEDFGVVTVMESPDVLGNRYHEGYGNQRISIVLKVEFEDSSPDRYFRKTGYTSSDDGLVLDSPIEEVKPVTDVITYVSVNR